MAERYRANVLTVICRCVVVLLNPQKNKQQHIFNSSR